MAPIPLLLAAAAALSLTVVPDETTRAAGQIRNGRQDQLDVNPPRLDEAAMRMDGSLDEIIESLRAHFQAEALNKN